MVNTPLEKTILSLDDLLAMGEDARIEIINGDIVEMNAAGAIHHILAGNIHDPLKVHIKAHDIGTVFFDGMTYLMFSPLSRLKDSFVPDVSFISNDNIPAGWNPEKPHPGIPDFAVEVVFPGDDADDVLAKVRTYLNKGTKQVWVVYPSTRELHQYRADQPDSVRIYRELQRIDTNDLFPGFELTMDNIFALPTWAQRTLE